MQRIALTFLALTLLICTGCPPPERVDLTPLPKPITSTGQRPGPTIIPPQPPRSSGTIGGVEIASLMPRGGIERGKWQAIIVHHSANAIDTPQGMDAWHRQRGWDGLGYDFVIGNGVNYPDGRVFVGHRWTQQLVGAHTKAGAGVYFGVPRPSNFFNERGVGICLIGNFENTRPTGKQMQSLQLLIQWISSQTGISTARVYGHGEVTHKTQCPGKFLRPELAQIRRNGVRVARFDREQADRLAAQIELNLPGAKSNADDLLALAALGPADADSSDGLDPGFDGSDLAWETRAGTSELPLGRFAPPTQRVEFMPFYWLGMRVVGGLDSYQE